MKKYIRHLFSLLMAVCMMGSIIIPSAQAANAGKSVDAPVAGAACIDLDGQISKIVPKENVPENQDMSRIIVNRGMRAFLTDVFVFPAIVDSDGSIKFSSSLGYHVTYPSPSSPTTFVNISADQTSTLISLFKSGTGYVPTVWLVIPYYNLYKAGDGSYPTYFQFDLTAADGTVTPYKKTVSRSATTANIPIAFPIPQGETAQYSVSMWGGFYYHNGSANSEGGSMAGVKVNFNA